MCGMRPVRGHHVAGNLQQGGSSHAPGRYGTVCFDGTGGGFGLFRWTYAGWDGIQLLWGRFNKGYFDRDRVSGPVDDRDRSLREIGEKQMIEKKI